MHMPAEGFAVLIVVGSVGFVCLFVGFDLVWGLVFFLVVCWFWRVFSLVFRLYFSFRFVWGFVLFVVWFGFVFSQQTIRFTQYPVLT